MGPEEALLLRAAEGSLAKAKASKVPKRTTGFLRKSNECYASHVAQHVKSLRLNFNLRTIKLQIGQMMGQQLGFCKFEVAPIDIKQFLRRLTLVTFVCHTCHLRALISPRVSCDITQ